MFFTPSMFSIGSAFDRLAAEFKDMSEPLRDAVTEVMIPSIRKNFEAEGRPKWAPTGPEASAQHAAILYRSGQLYDAATSLDIWTIDSNVAAVTSMPTDYGQFHQFGTNFMPSRPFLVMQDEDAADIEWLFGEWVDERIRGVL